MFSVCMYVCNTQNIARRIFLFLFLLENKGAFFLQFAPSACRGLSVVGELGGGGERERIPHDANRKKPDEKTKKEKKKIRKIFLTRVMGRTLELRCGGGRRARVGGKMFGCLGIF